MITILLIMVIGLFVVSFLWEIKMMSWFNNLENRIERLENSK